MLQPLAYYIVLNLILLLPKCNSTFLKTDPSLAHAPTGTWVNTKSSGVLRSNHPNSMRAMVLHLGYESYLGHIHMDQSLLVGETRPAFEIYSKGEDFWTWIHKVLNCITLFITHPWLLYL